MFIESLKLGLSFVSILLTIAAVISMLHPKTNPTLGTSEPERPSSLYRKLKHTHLLSTQKWCSPLSVSLIGLTIPSTFALLGILITEEWLPALILFLIVIFMEFILLDYLILKKEFDIVDSMKMFLYLMIHESAEDEKKGPAMGTITNYLCGTMHLCLKYSLLEATLSNNTIKLIDALKRHCDNFLFQDLLDRLVSNENLIFSEKAKKILEEDSDNIETQRRFLKSRIKSSVRKLIFLGIVILCLLIYWAWYTI